MSVVCSAAHNIQGETELAPREKSSDLAGTMVVYLF